MDAEFNDNMDPNITEGISEGIAHDHFAEVDEVNNLIDNIPNAVSDLTSKEMSDEKFTEIVDKYLEQPHLLDPHLDNLLQKLLSYVQNKSTPVDQFHCAFKYIYLLTKVRGHKIMIRKFPHEVSDLEPVLEMLSRQSVHDQNTWETRYMLLLWLSMICLIPFNMKKFDVPENIGGKKQSVTERILEFGKMYLTMSSDNCQEAAVLLLAKFVTRPDIYKDQLSTLVNWCMDKLENNDPGLMVGLTQMKGALSVMAMVFKHGKRDDLLPYCKLVLDKVQSCNVQQINNTVLRKLNTKLVQRLGMTLLKPKVATWRYKRGNRSLDDTLRLSNVPKPECVVVEEEEDEDYDIPDEVESVLELVLNALKDKDTVVRWSAAKGVGRITGRLPKELANEIVESVLENFSFSQSDGAWHGGCLALAELGRRGLLLPECLGNVVPILLKALTYDERRGASSVGSHVRDAACYLAWSFARAYSADTLKKYVNEIAETLLVTTVFDREVNCRRAASAAFQENVGRQGHFPHGIAILTIADYFAVSNRSNTYLKVSPMIGEYKEYTTALINNLTTQKRDHWDDSIRWLTAQSMHKLTKLKSDYVATTVLNKLVPLCTGMDLITRHGSILIVAEVFHSLHEVEQNGKVGLLSRNPSVKGILRIVKQLSDSKLFRGSGGELMRVAACHLIFRVSQCSETVSVPKLVIDQWTELLHETLSNLHTFTRTEEICNTAISALSSINDITLVSDPFKAVSTSNQECHVEAVDQYLSHLSSNTERQRCGYAQAVASLPKPILQNCFTKVCSGLIRATTVCEPAETAFAESRRDAVQALARVCATVGVSPENNSNVGLCGENVEVIVQAILNAMCDYTRDKRGDIGSEVRKAAVKAIGGITVMVAQKDTSLIGEKLITQIMCGVLQQAGEKIHKVRDLAVATFVTLLHDKHITNIPRKKDLTAVFPKKLASFSMIQLFERLAKLLSIEVYSYHILLGMVVSSGDLTQSLAEASSAALFTYMDSIRENRNALDQFCGDLLEVFKNHVKQDRVSVPLLKTLNHLLIQDCFSLLIDNESSFPTELLTLVKSEISKSKDAQKLLVSINVFCSLLQFRQKEFRMSVMSQLMIMLCHRFPVVRRATSSQLYETILTYDDLCDPENMDAVVNALSETEWDQPVGELRSLRNELCTMFGVQVPRLAKKVAQ
uniref:Tubulin-specific chaperone D n=1 Tax=Phallusia mammillata TaxID=59560 RepID=A0A6F9DUN7_9ASCI|nr:tubulin-specific chaperone D-like [Phallusia mammillata]